MQPLILDLDASVGTLPSETRVDLRDWHDRLRFACSLRQLQLFDQQVSSCLPASHGTVLFGSGDFHHLSLPLIARTTTSRPMRVLVFDNHPDNMRFPFGVHCGSWVSRVAALPHVARVDVVGITSQDIAADHAWENRLFPLYRGRLRYWSIGVETGWSGRLGLRHAFRNFDTASAMMAALLDDFALDDCPVYLSIDKDVLAPDEARSNWDQGCLRVADLEHAIAALRHRLIGSDINGEVSIANYPQRWKRVLSAIDGQPDLDDKTLAAYQAQQHSVNLRLLGALQGG